MEAELKLIKVKVATIVKEVVAEIHYVTGYETGDAIEEDEDKKKGG